MGKQLPKAGVTDLRLRPITLAEARRFVGIHHRHNLPPVFWRFGVGIESASKLVGVGMAGKPTARKLMTADPYLIEIIRVTVTDAPNGCSMLYWSVVSRSEGPWFPQSDHLTRWLKSPAQVCSPAASGWTLK